MADPHNDTGDEAERRHKNLRFDLLRNAYYNDDRSQFFYFVDRMSKSISILAGTAIAGKVLSDTPNGTVFLALIVTILQIVSVVFNLVTRAGYHAERKAKYYEMLSELDENSSEDDIARVRAELTRQHEKEPTMFWGADALAWNSAYCGMVETVRIDALIQMRWYEQLLRHIVRFSPQYFRTRTLSEAFEESKAR